MSKFPFIIGDVVLQSNLEIEEVGKLLSEKIFGGLQFGGKELEIYEEVPAVFISSSILGLRVVLQGYKGFGDTDGYVLTISPDDSMTYDDCEELRLDNYLTMHFKSVLVNNVVEIKVLDVDLNRK